MSSQAAGHLAFQHNKLGRDTNKEWEEGCDDCQHRKNQEDG
jgi:hypothetical protein